MTETHGVSVSRRAADRLLELPFVYETWQAPFVSAKLKPFLANVDLGRTRRVLDIGCGPGTNARVFAGCDYVGIDKPFDVKSVYTNEFLDRSIRMTK